MFFHFINCKNFHLNVFWVSSIIQINKLLFLLSLSLLFWLHDQQIYLQKREVFSEDNLRIIFTFYRKITHLLHFLPIFTHLTSYILHISLKITSYLLPIWSTFTYEGSVLSLCNKGPRDRDSKFHTMIWYKMAWIDMVLNAF